MALSGWNADQKLRLTVPQALVDTDQEDIAAPLFIAGSQVDTDTKLLIHSDNSDGSTTFTDSSSSGHTITPSGNTHHDTDQSKFGNTSIYFDGTGDYLTVPDSSDFNFGSGELTIDFWVRRATTGREIVCGWLASDGSTLSGFWIEFDSSNYLNVSIAFTDSTSDNSLFSTAITDTLWRHIALVRDGNTFDLYVDGTSVDSFTTTKTIVTPQSDFAAGRGGEYDGLYFNGYIDEIRISKGIARWTANFTPLPRPYTEGSGTTAYDCTDVFDKLSPLDPSDDFTGTDGDSPNPTLWEEVTTDSSLDGASLINSNQLRIYKVGTGLASYDSASLRLLPYISGDFTILVDFVAFTSGLNQVLFIFFGDDFDESNCMMVYEHPTGYRVRQYVSGSYTQLYNGSGTLAGSTVKAVRTTNSVSIYVDDVLRGTYASFGSADSSLLLRAGGGSSALTLDVKFDNFTVSSGTVVWPTTPLKFAIEQGNTGNQCYIEKVEWDYAGKWAKLWVGWPDLDASADEIYNFYYDETHADNTTYVGVTNSTPGEAVYASKYAGVWHHNNTPAGTDSILDSTSNANHGTSYNMGSANLVDTQFGKAHVFNGTDEYIDTGNTYTSTDRSLFSFAQPGAMPTTGNSGLIMSNGQGVLYWNHASSTYQGCVTADYSGSWPSAKFGVTSIVGYSSFGGVFTSSRMTSYLNGAQANEITPSGSVTSDSSSMKFATDAGVTSYMDVIISETIIMSSEEDDSFFEIMDLAMRDELVTWALPSDGILAYIEQGYGDAYITITNYLNQIYHLLTWNQNHVEQIYGLHLGAHIDMFFGDAPTIQAYIAQWYKSAGLLKNFLDQEYWDAQQLKAMLEQPYVIPQELKAYVEALYHTMSRENQSYLVSYYDVKDASILKNYLDKLYALAPDGSFLTQDNSVTVGGTELEIVALDIEFSQGSYVGDVTIQLKNKAQWTPLDYEEPIVVTCGTDVYHFELTEKNKREDHKGYTVTIGGKSPAYKLDFPYALPVNAVDEEDPADQFLLNAMASDICIRLAALEGITLTWDIPVDWYLTSDDVEVVGESPINAIKKITSEVKAIVQSDPDGSIYVEPLNIINTNGRDDAPPDYYLTSGANLYTTDSSLEKRDGYNSFSITNVEDSYQYTIEHEVISDTEILVKVFQPTWTSDEVVLSTSELDSTVITRLPDVFDSAQCELVEIVSGAGSISKPAGLASFSYKDNTDLGTISYKENGEFTTAIKGESIVEVIYNTQYRQWRVTNDEIESVQLILTRVE